MGGLNLVGQRFTRLLVIEECGRRNTFKLWRCICDCGKEVFVTTGHLRNGDTKSCGCFNRAQQKELHTKHGMSKTRLHGIWLNMRKRCYDETNNRFYRYGGRGITVCDDWKGSFENFRDWAISNGYSEGKSLDRIDNDGNYCPENCTWSDAKTQARNRRTSHLEYGKTLSEWSEILGINYDLLQQRIVRDGLTLEQAVTKPVRKIGNRDAYVPVQNFKIENYI